MNPRIVLAYSGGARSSAAIATLAARHDAEIVALTLDLAQGGDLEAARDRALALGAVRAHVLDAREEFARHFLLPALKADVLYDERRSRAVLLSRPLIAQKLVEIAGIEQTMAVAHGSVPAEPQISIAARALVPAFEVFAVDTAAVAAAALQTPARRLPGECPDEPAVVEITFTRGTPAAINGVAMPLVDLIASLDIIAGAHGVGISAGLESPAAIVLHTTHRDLNDLAVTGDALASSRAVSRQYAEIVERGAWFSPAREALQTDVDAIQDRVNGVVRLRLFKGDCTIVEHHLVAPPMTPGAPARRLTFIETAKA